MRFLLRAVSQTLFVIGALLFLVGGRAISEFTKMERVLAEVLGIGLAIACAAFGMLAKRAADNLNDEDPAGQ